MKKYLLFSTFLLLNSGAVFSQGSGLFNGEITQWDYYNSITDPNTGCSTFYNVFNWTPVDGAPKLVSNHFRMVMGHENNFPPHDSTLTQSVAAGYNWIVGETYFVQVNLQFEQYSGPFDMGFDLFAAKDLDQQLGYARTENCVAGNTKYIHPDWEQITHYNMHDNNAQGYVYYTVEAPYTCTKAGLYQIFFRPYCDEWWSAACNLDYIRIRKCGSGSILLENQTLSGKYLKENITAGTNTTTSTVAKTEMMGQHIILNPGFSSSPVNGNGTVVIYGVPDCNMPIEPQVISKTVDPSVLSQLRQLSQREIQLLPNPANDYIELKYQRGSSKTDEFFIINSIGQVIIKTERQLDFDINSTHKERIELSAIPQGTYFIRVRSGDLVYNSRFTKLNR